jgi:hypothetical protein
MRRFLAAVLLASFSLAVACIAIELGVRLLHLVPTSFFEPDPLVGTRLIPGQRGWWTQEELEFRTLVQINREGFHDIDHAREKPDGVTRILILGDSFIEALQVPLEANVARRLQAALDAEGKKVEVISMGTSGFGTAGELLLYERFGRAYAPDIVILNFYVGNDVRNNSPVLEPGLPPVYAADGSVQRIVAPKRPRERGMFGRLLAWSDSYRFLRKRIVTQNPKLAAILIRLGLLSAKVMDRIPMVDGIPVDYWVFAKNGGPQAAEWDDAWRHTEDLLQRFRTTVERDGAHFMMSIATLRERIYPESWQAIVSTYPAMQNVEWDLAAPEARVEVWCREHGVPCVELTPVFLAHKDGPRLHWVYDGHWTEAGHALAGNTLANTLRAQKEFGIGTAASDSEGQRVVTGG